VQLKGRARATVSPAQGAQQAALAEAAARWIALDPLAQATWEEYAFEGLPPASAAGNAVASGRQAYIQFRLMQWQSGYLLDYWWPLIYPYVSAGPVTARASANPGGTFTVWTSWAIAHPGLALNVARCPSLDRYSSRPLYAPLYEGSRQGVPAWVADATYTDMPYKLDLSAAWRVACPGARAGDSYQVRALRGNGVRFGVPSDLWTLAVQA
jgi:hypothetical protein